MEGDRPVVGSYVYRPWNGLIAKLLREAVVGEVLGDIKVGGHWTSKGESSGPKEQYG